MTLTQILKKEAKKTGFPVVGISDIDGFATCLEACPIGQKARQ